MIDVKFVRLFFWEEAELFKIKKVGTLPSSAISL